MRPGKTTYVEVRLERIPPPLSGSVEGRIYLNGELAEGVVTLRCGGFVDSESGGPEEPYRFDRVPPGVAEMAVVPFECLSHRNESDPFEYRWLEGHVATVPVLDGQVTQHDFHVTVPMKTIEGSVRYADGNPGRERIEVMCDQVCFMGETEADGTYSFDVPVTGGKYDVRLPGLTGAPRYEVSPGAGDVDFDLGAVCEVWISAFLPEDNTAIERFSVLMRRPGDAWYVPSLMGRDPSGARRFRCVASTLEVEVRVDRSFFGRALVEVAPGRSNRFSVAVENGPR